MFIISNRFNTKKKNLSIHKNGSNSCAWMFLCEKQLGLSKAIRAKTKGERIAHSYTHTQKNLKTKRKKNHTNGARRGNRARPWLRLRRTSVVTPAHQVTKPPRPCYFDHDPRPMTPTHPSTPLGGTTRGGFDGKTRVFRGRGAQLRRLGCHDRQRDDVTSGRHISSYGDVTRSEFGGNLEVSRENVVGSVSDLRAGGVAFECGF